MIDVTVQCYVTDQGWGSKLASASCAGHQQAGDVVEHREWGRTEESDGKQKGSESEFEKEKKKRQDVKRMLISVWHFGETQFYSCRPTWDTDAEWETLLFDNCWTRSLWHSAEKKKERKITRQMWPIMTSSKLDWRFREIVSSDKQIYIYVYALTLTFSFFQYFSFLSSS